MRSASFSPLLLHERSIDEASRYGDVVIQTLVRAQESGAKLALLTRTPKLLNVRAIKCKKKPANLRLRANGKPGNDLLSHTLVCSTIGDEGLDF